MGSRIKKQYDEIMKKQNETLLMLLKEGHRELIVKVIKDYLSTIE